MDNYVLPTKPKPSEKYLELIEAYKHLHKDEGKFQGISLTPFVLDVVKAMLIKKTLKSLILKEIYLTLINLYIYGGE